MKKTENTQTNATENALHPQPMKVDVKISSIRPEGSIRATASINLNDCFAIRNVKVMESSKGMFVAMPSYKAGNGEYKDICFPVTAAFRQQLNDAVMDAYRNALTQGQKTAENTQAQTQEQDDSIQMG
ncbi:MAG TPA: SpoVG family protein [Ruminiclostridium sp.]|nr:SpoVG family protein [Ruminiclostridium sp.]